MNPYNQSQLFEVLLDAAVRPGYIADPGLLAKYRKTRLDAALRAIKSQNLFLFTEGSRPTTDVNSTTTIYTQPVGHRMMLIGYTENFRYGRISDAPTGAVLWVQVESGGADYSIGDLAVILTGDGHAEVVITGVDGSGAVTGITLIRGGSGYSVTGDVATESAAGGTGFTVDILAVSVSGPVDKVWSGEHRVRIIGGKERAICEDFYPSQAGVSGEARYTSGIFTVPEILEPQEQIAVDLGYDTAMDPATVIVPQSFVFYALKVKDKLTQEDIAAMEDVKRAILALDFQKGQYLNCVSLGLESVHFDTAVAGGRASCDTRTITAPMLITGIGTNLAASQIKITDTGNGSSFSLDKFIRVSAINMPDYEDQGATDTGSPVSAPDFTMYHQFPVPHLLRGGSSLHVDVVNGGNQGLGTDTVLDPQDGCVIMFQGISV